MAGNTSLNGGRHECSLFLQGEPGKLPWAKLSQPQICSGSRLGRKNPISGIKIVEMHFRERHGGLRRVRR